MPSMSAKRDDVLSASSVDEQHHTLAFRNPVHEIQRSKCQIQAVADNDLRTGRPLRAERALFQVLESTRYGDQGAPSAPAGCRTQGSPDSSNVPHAKVCWSSPREAWAPFAAKSIAPNMRSKPVRVPTMLTRV